MLLSGPLDFQCAGPFKTIYYLSRFPHLCPFFLKKKMFFFVFLLCFFFFFAISKQDWKENTTMDTGPITSCTHIWTSILLLITLSPDSQKSEFHKIVCSYLLCTRECTPMWRTIFRGRGKSGPVAVSSSKLCFLTEQRALLFMIVVGHLRALCCGSLSGIKDLND